MPERLIALDDLKSFNGPDNIASLFRQLGYKFQVSPLDASDLELFPQSTAAIYRNHLIADQENRGLQVLLFHLQSEEWASPSLVSRCMNAIAYLWALARPKTFSSNSSLDAAIARIGCCCLAWLGMSWAVGGCNGS